MGDDRSILTCSLMFKLSQRHVFRQIEGNRNGDTAATLANNIHQLRQEVARLKQLLAVEELNHQKKMAEFSKEERHIREENLRLQRKLQLEMERRWR